MARNQHSISSLLWSLMVLFFTLLMGRIVYQYTSWEWDVDFLVTKQFIVHLDYYRWSFYTHIFSSVFVLGAGAFLFSNYIVRKWPLFHRYVGRLYVGLVLLLSAPSGLVMAFHANGGWPAKISFIVLAPLWWYFTWKGLQTARNRQFIGHKKWMLRSYALSFSAVTLRACQMILGTFWVIDPVVQYVAVSWGSWVGNLAVVELILIWPFLKKYLSENILRKHALDI